MVKVSSKHWLVSYWIFCFLLTHLPLNPAAVPIQGLDKLVHFTLYLGLALLLLKAKGLSSPTGDVIRKSLLLIVGYSVLDELTQPLVNRTFEVWDLIADWLGAITGVLLIWKSGLGRPNDREQPQR